jgi:NADH dehydrogenase FAD-containing subunit
VKLVFDEKVVDHKNGTFFTDKSRTIKADVGIWCAGISYNPSFMQDFVKSALTERKALKVNKYLQLDGYPHIFVGGDITSVKEEKTAQNAERHARLISTNLNRLIKKQPLIPYTPRSTPLVLSLSDWTGIITFSNLVITGLIPGVLKRFIEWKALRLYK